MRYDSPGQQVWRRFRKNGAAMSGLAVIALAILVALCCTVIRSDESPEANRICLPIGNQRPGFTSDFLLLRKNQEAMVPGLWQQFWNGTPDSMQWVAVSDWRIASDTVFYHEWSPDALLPEQFVLLAEAVWPILDPHQLVNTDGKWSARDVYGAIRTSSTEELRTTFSEHQVTRRTFLLGTDRYGRDMLSRLLTGTRITFFVGLVAVVIALLVGVTLGSLAGFFRGRIDRFILWLINVTWSMPTLLLVIAITLLLGKGFSQVFIAVGLTLWVDVARLVRGQIFSVREQEFVTAGRALGYKNARVIFRHILPNIAGPVLVVAAANFSTAILLEAGLSFLGIGAQPPTPSWGAMIKENYGYIILPGTAYLAVLPGLAILLLTLAFTFVANGLRDALDSRQQLLSA
ncbi:MAG: ABC transporter permease [Bacteroidota bacterium]